MWHSRSLMLCRADSFPVLNIAQSKLAGRESSLSVMTQSLRSLQSPAMSCSVHWRKYISSQLCDCKASIKNGKRLINWHASPAKQVYLQPSVVFTENGPERETSAVSVVGENWLITTSRKKKKQLNKLFLNLQCSSWTVVRTCF